jgi:hypothetical protein
MHQKKASTAAAVATLAEVQTVSVKLNRVC